MDTNSQKMSLQITKVLQTKTHINQVDIADVADTLGTSTSLISLKLKQENTSFYSLKQNVLISCAIKYLLNTDYPAMTISEVLGYSEPKAFSRAFKRWTGLSPIAYRRVNLEEG